MRAPGTAPDPIPARFTIRQMAIAIAVIAVVLALAVQVPSVLVAGGDAILVGFGSYKLARVLSARDVPRDEPPWPPLWCRMVIATTQAVLILGLLVGWLFPVTTH